MKGMLSAGVVAVILGLGPAPALAQMPTGAGANMPDAKSMSGMPLPAGDVAVGTVVVRVVRGSMANPLAGESVELTGAGAPRTGTTNETGRAEFTGIEAGARVKAVAVVAGERMESQEFAVPASGGIRVALVATDPEMEKRAAEDRKLAQAPAQPGIVVLGGESRFVFEFGDEGLHVFNLMDVVNTARTPVEPPSPLVFEVPPDARSLAVLEGSSPQAVVEGARVVVKGPFAPGTTSVQFAYALSLSRADLTVQQTLPAALNQLTVMAHKVGDLHLTSPQFSQHRDMAGDGRAFVLGQGPALKAGDTVVFNFTGLPHTPRWPLNVALVLAVAVLGAGAWGSVRGPAAVNPGREARRRKIEAKRDRLFGDLASLEEQHRRHAVDGERYTARRRELVASLERIYAELDEEAAA